MSIIKEVSEAERKIAMLACGFGLIRSGLSTHLGIKDGLTDILLLGATASIAFIVILGLLITKRYLRFSIFFLSFFISFLIFTSFLMFGGAEGKESHLFMIWMGVVMVINKFQNRRVFGLSIMVLILALFAIQYAFPSFHTTILARYSTGNTNYIFGIGGSIILMYYIKLQLQLESKMLTIRKVQVESKIKLMQVQKKELVQEREALNNLQNTLEVKVAEKASELVQKNSAINRYLELNIKKLQSPVKEIHATIHLMANNQPPSELLQLLRLEAEELQSVSKEIKLNLTHGKEIKRDNFSKR